MSKKISKSAIASAEKLLNEILPEQIVKDYPDMRSPLMCVLYRSNSLTMIAELFTNAGYKISRQYIGQVVLENGIVKEVKTRKDTKAKPPITPELIAEILERFHRSETKNDIRAAVHKDYKTIDKVLAEHGLSFKARSLASRKVQIGDRFGNWEVIGYEPNQSSLCRDVRNGVENVIVNHNLIDGKTTGCRKLAIAGVRARKLKGLPVTRIEPKVKAGDRFGNWEVIYYINHRHSLCRDVRNGVEAEVGNHALLNGTSKGCREIAINNLRRSGFK